MLNHKFIGNENADTIVIFLHQGLGSISQWRDFPTKVCAAINAYGYIYDRAGYGQSPGNLKDRTAAYLHEAADELSTPHYILIKYLRLYLKQHMYWLNRLQLMA